MDTILHSHHSSRSSSPTHTPSNGQSSNPTSGFTAAARHALGDKPHPAKTDKGEDGYHRPDLDRNPESNDKSKFMPDSAFTSQKQAELNGEGGETEERKRDLKEAGAKMRAVMGGLSEEDAKRAEEDHEAGKEDEERKERERENEVQKATPVSNQKLDDPRAKSPDADTPTAAQKSQQPWLETDQTPFRQPPQTELADVPSPSQSQAKGKGKAPAQENEDDDEGNATRSSSPENMEALDRIQDQKGENGDVPGKMRGSKGEDKPGPRLAINLKPRINKIAYHTASANELNSRANNVPVEVSADGETEVLPNGKPFRYAGDQENKLTSTREAERERTTDGDYTVEHERMMAEVDEKIANEHKAPGDGKRGLGEWGGEEGDQVGELGGKGKKKDEWKERIPKADHGRSGASKSRASSVRESEDEGDLESANNSPAGNSRPRNKRIWSSLRGSEPVTHSGKGKGKEREGESSPATPAANRGTMQGAFDKERELPEQEHTVGQKKWATLRHKMLSRMTTTAASTALAHSSPARIPLTSELLAGQLPVMILKTWLDRDEKGRKAVPVLLGNMRFRVGDSAGLGDGRENQTGREIFRVECEYGDGAVKWVIYRDLKDFISLHGHYKADNLGSRVQHLNSSRKVEIPDFPRTSIPYLNKLRRKEDSEDAENEKAKNVERHKSKAEHSRESREALQQYLVELIRAVMFRPEAARLCKFFELSSLTLSLAPRGGFQGKAGFLKIIGTGASRRSNQPGLLPTTWYASREPKWWIVRESYFVAADGPESTEFYEVFLIDSDFAIERPKRAFRHGLNVLTGHGTFRSLLHGHDSDDHDDKDNSKQSAIAAAAGSGGALKDDDGQLMKQPALNENDGNDASQHTFYIQNSQRKLKLVAKNVRQMQQFIVSMERVAAQCIWQGRNRFDSYAPIRMNVAAQWLVDGRDYFWNLSRAMNMAKETIYIHDWWLSPELYLRRPGNERYRLDNLLKRKAEEGVKVFIIIYNEVSDKTTPVDSNYTKKRMMGLHKNVMVQRSPSHFQTGTFYWSHHEKMCVIDETIAFMGGLDLCYGRWDTSQHVLIDDDFEPGAVGENGPVWPGKDMANERVVEFHTLNKPFEDSFDRTKVPRMPWHDVGLQLVGQPARDLCRHFVQRWNQLIRTKNHSRPMPFLLPAPDYSRLELQNLRLEGTCEVQICRSCGPWSMGTSTKVEHSIQNAYLKAIQLSDHFVYIENQFFITSTVVDGIQIENRIGDALVDRIIRACKSDTPWRACIVIPLLPGYTFPIDTAEASSVRLILECQNRTISRGTNSIFSRLRKEGIDPDDYITFFALRTWGKFKSGALTTEQVYIHGKTMVVDDRIVICGSANINERSQRGDRDSELAAVIRDTDMIDSTMAGKPFKVGRFAHSLRMRLMREHAGIDVDAIEEEQLIGREPIAREDELEKWDPDNEQNEGDNDVSGVTRVKKKHARDRLAGTVQDAISSVTKGMSENAISNVKKTANFVIKPISVLKDGNIVGTKHNKDGAENGEREDFDREGALAQGFASSVVPTLEERIIFERRPSASHTNGKPLFDALDDGEGMDPKDVPEATVEDGPKSDDKDPPIDADKDGGSRSAPKITGKPGDKELYGAPANAVENDDDVPNRDTKRSDASKEEKAAIKARQTLRKHLNAKVGVSPWTMPTPTPLVDPEAFKDPLSETFWKDIWCAVAVHNTEIYRKVFRCIPDDLVTSWASYKNFTGHAEKFNRTPTDITPNSPSHEPVKTSHTASGGTHGAGGGGSGGGIVGQKGGDNIPPIGSDIVDGKHTDHPSGGHPSNKFKEEEGDVEWRHSHGNGAAHGHGEKEGGKKEASGEEKREKAHHRKPTGPDEAFADWEREEMEELLEEVRGHLVIYPTRFLEAEDLANNFLFNSDKILPLPIYD